MIVVMRPDAERAETAVCSLIRSEGLEAFVSEGQERVIIGVVGIDIDRVAHIGYSQTSREDQGIDNVVVMAWT